MIRACLWLLAGVYALQLSSFADYSDLAIIGLVALCLGIISRNSRPLLVLLAGAVLFLSDARTVIDSRIDNRYAGDSIVAQVRIASFPERNGDRLSFAADTIASPLLPPRVRLSWYQTDTEVRIGDVWQLELRLRRPRGASNPGGFDYEAWLLRERIGAVGYVVSGPRNRLIDAHAASLTQRLRQHVVERLVAVTGDAGETAVLAAITVGARHLITTEQWQRYARTGTSHLMAISGLHVSLAAAGGYLLAVLVAAGMPFAANRHLLATTGALVVAVGYASWSGFAVPAQRASLMVGLAAAAIVSRRELTPSVVVATVCVAIVTLWPLASMAPGFKLSFAAVLVLLWVARRYPGARARRLPEAVRRLGVMQIALLLGLMPLTVLEFSRVAFAAPLVNALAVPLFSFVTVPFALTGVVLDGVLSPVGDRALLVAAYSLRMLEQLIQFTARLPGVEFLAPQITIAGWVLVCTPLIWVVLPTGWPGRNVAFVAVGALLLYQPPRPPPGCVDIDVLDVGQGLAAVATTHRHSLVYDTGPAYRSGGSAATSTLLPFLRFRGVSKLDALIVSHADLDHAGGVTALLAGIKTDKVWSGEALPAPGTRSRPCVAGEAWLYDGIRFEFVYPSSTVTYDGNDASCVLLVTAGTHRILLPGDIERPAERMLVQTGSLPAVTAVVVPHHGSLTSSSLPLVAALRPELAVVSAGFGNHWGLPRQEVVMRWQQVGAEVVTTGTAGAVGMRVCAHSGLQTVTRQRRERHRIWQE